LHFMSDDCFGVRIDSYQGTLLDLHTILIGGIDWSFECDVAILCFLIRIVGFGLDGERAFRTFLSGHDETRDGQFLSFGRLD